MAYLTPVADDYLGPGGHVKMHTAVLVDNAAPEGALKIRDDGFVLVSGVTSSPSAIWRRRGIGRRPRPR